MTLGIDANTPNDQELSPLHDRLHEVFAGQSYRAIGDATKASSETVRRYMQGQSPSVEFLAQVCHTAGVNGQWLLTGRGPKKAEHIRAQALDEANASELLSAIARTLERLIERVDRLELFVQTMETRLRAQAARQDLERAISSPKVDSNPSGDERSSHVLESEIDIQANSRPSSGDPEGGRASQEGVQVRARAIADAIRPSEDSSPHRLDGSAAPRPRSDAH